MDRLLLVDGNSLINRAYYATSLTNGATYGFLNMLFRAVQNSHATRVAIAFDVRAKTFRHKMYDSYKANRKGMPDDLARQLLDLKEILEIMKVAILEKEGYEADDIIGTVARRTSEAGQCSTVILSADRDGMQLIDKCTELHLTKSGVTSLDIWNYERVLDEYGFEPEKFIDLKALMGDKSDNIPGAQGIGEKTALALIKEFGDIDNLYSSTDNEKLISQKDIVYLSKKLAAIDCSVPIDYDASSFNFALPMSKEVFEAFKARNFYSLMNRKNLWGEAAEEKNEDKKQENPCEQLSFFETKKPEKKTAEHVTEAAHEIDTELEPVLARMHENGAKIDLKALQSVSDKYAGEISVLSDKIYAHAGEQFNINSPQQLGNILYKKLGIETVQKTKTGLSTNESVLHKIEKLHPIVSEILRYRKIYKLYSTYIQGLKTQADGEGFVHSKFQSNTSTGRLTSTEPNLQNIPARSDDAQTIRSLFVSRFDGGQILTADYSQIELRILAHLSKDPLMQAAFKNNHDIHEETAKQLGIDRRQAKAVNFGITYGQTSFGLSEALGVPVGDAARIIESYFTRFSGVKKYLDGCRDFAVTHGYIETMFGRRRSIPELASRNQHVVGFGTRAAMNMPMQGAAADIIKKAMLALDGEITKRDLKSIMIIQIHDELVFDVPKDEINIMSGLVKEIMESAVSLDVPLSVNVIIKGTL